MNLEAAKAVKYGGISEEKALEFVTINPAIQLGIENKVGRLKLERMLTLPFGQDTRFQIIAFANRHGLRKTIFFIRAGQVFRARDKKLRNDIIQKILISNETGTLYETRQRGSQSFSLMQNRRRPYA